MSEFLASPAGEWLHLLVRWAHVFAGILWIGATYYFTWLDGRMHDPKEGGQVWMVHSGGFYVVRKESRADLSRPLHWFRWEAALTWLTGALLVVLVYYLGGVMVDDEVAKLSNATAVAIGAGALALAWPVYELLWRSPLGRDARVGVVASYALAVAVAYGLTHVLSGRAAYLHVGAMFGTIMAGNVWFGILPAQKALLAAIREGREPDPTLAERAKRRSKHNTFLVMPVVFTMIGNHFPTATYGHRYNWAILAVLILGGWIAAKFVRE